MEPKPLPQDQDLDTGSGDQDLLKLNLNALERRPQTLISRLDWALEFLT